MKKPSNLIQNLFLVNNSIFNALPMAKSLLSAVTPVIKIKSEAEEVRALASHF